MAIPDRVKHNFYFAFNLTQAALDSRKVYKCRYCQCWTDDLDSTNEKDQVCPQRERRTVNRRVNNSGGRRAGDRGLIYDNGKC